MKSYEKLSFKNACLTNNPALDPDPILNVKSDPGPKKKLWIYTNGGNSSFLAGTSAAMDKVQLNCYSVYITCYLF
jgi:hypothetical protein